MKTNTVPRMFILLTTLFFALIFTHPVHADIAPPDFPPGSNPVPGSEVTQVRLVAETVVLELQPRGVGTAVDQPPAKAHTTATFTLRNLAAQSEKMAVRFPLTFWNGENDGFFRFPEIQDFQAFVDGKSVRTRRVSQASPFGNETTEIPWAEFDVTFPAEKKVEIKVAYTCDGMGYTPLATFRYVLETGAGWKDTIGSADIVVRLPYEANLENTILGDPFNYIASTPGAVLGGREIRWHFENFEPTARDNIEITLAIPQLYQKVLDQRQAVQANPKNGEAWGQLGKALKTAIQMPKGLRTDPGGQDLYRESEAAYQKSVELLPKDALWHLGYADLLWQNFYWNGYLLNQPDFSSLQTALEQIYIARQLAPNEPRIQEELDWISGSYPKYVSKTGSSYDFLFLTATPALSTNTPTENPTDTPTPVTDTSTPSPTVTSPAATDTLTPTIAVEPTRAVVSATQPSVGRPRETPAAQATATPATGGSPFCGAGVLATVLPLTALLWLWKRSLINA
jgi:tetratricopeptide (TPR) repeat protein